MKTPVHCFLVPCCKLMRIDSTEGFDVGKREVDLTVRAQPKRFRSKHRTPDLT